MKPPPLRRLLLWGALLTATFLVPPATAVAERPPSAGGEADLNMVFVLDGLRPDSINPVDTPNLYRLRREGVSWTNSHAAVPTVTRVNSSVIGSGAYPANTGIVGNTMYVPASSTESATATWTRADGSPSSPAPRGAPPIRGRVAADASSARAGAANSVRR
jgi:predicted AlkP superfamily pyrophosphatase or phosphodiesterase